MRGTTYLRRRRDERTQEPQRSGGKRSREHRDLPASESIGERSRAHVRLRSLDVREARHALRQRARPEDALRRSPARDGAPRGRGRSFVPLRCAADVRPADRGRAYPARRAGVDALRARRVGHDRARDRWRRSRPRAPRRDRESVGGVAARRIRQQADRAGRAPRRDDVACAPRDRARGSRRGRPRLRDDSPQRAPARHARVDAPGADRGRRRRPRAGARSRDRAAGRGGTPPRLDGRGARVGRRGDRHRDGRAAVTGGFSRWSPR